MLAALPVSGSQQLRLLRTHPRVALNSAQHNGIGGRFFRLLWQKISGGVSPDEKINNNDDSGHDADVAVPAPRVS